MFIRKMEKVRQNTVHSVGSCHVAGVLRLIRAGRRIPRFMDHRGLDIYIGPSTNGLGNLAHYQDSK